MKVWIDHDDGHAGGYPHECDRCACGQIVHAGMPYVEVEADGVLWHGNAQGGGHRYDVDPA